MKNFEEYKLSQHVKERYSERIMSKEEAFDINIFINNNLQKIKDDIMKMLEHSALIYTGKTSTNNNRIVEVYLSGTWVLILDPGKKIVVTLYKIDLGLDEDFNKEYVSRFGEKITKKSLEVINRTNDSKETTTEYKAFIEDNNQQIKEYRKYIKNLEDTNIAYEQLIKDMQFRVSIAEKELRDTVLSLIGKKEFV
jgi:hypothetical protein